MKITKRGLRRLIKEMIKVEKGLIKESKDTPLRRIIREEMQQLNEDDCMAGKPCRFGVQKLIQVKDFENMKDRGAIYVEGFNKSDGNQLMVKVSKSSRIGVNIRNEMPSANIGATTKAKIDEMLGGIYIDTTHMDGKLKILSNDSLINRVLDKFSQGGKIKQRVELLVPAGVMVYHNGVEIKLK